MIKIAMGPYKLYAKGHAGFDESGKDVICAAVSALVQALALGLEREERRGGLSRVEIKLESGEALLSVVPSPNCEREVRLLFDVFAEALLRIAEEYPEYVEVQSCG